METINDFRTWSERCAERGWQGPFKVSGQPHWQYTSKTGGITAKDQQP